MFGYSEREVLGKPMSIIGPPDRIHEFEAIMDQVRKVTGRALRNPRKRKNGTVLDVSVIVSPVLNEPALSKKGDTVIPLRVLIVDDSESDAVLLLRELRKVGYSPQYKRIDTIEGMEHTLTEQEWDIVLCDHVMPYFSSTEALKVLHRKILTLSG